MWSTEVGENVYTKTRLVSSRQHRATEVRKLRSLSSCQYTHGCCAPASWAARHTDTQYQKFEVMGLLIKNELDIQCFIGNTPQIAVYDVRFVVKVMKYV